MVIDKQNYTQPVKITDETDVGYVRRKAVKAAQNLGFAETKQGNLAIVSTELARNIFRHARHGHVLINACRNRQASFIDVVAVDKGPGMPDIQQCLKDGYSTIGTAGDGLGAVMRLSDDFDVYSVPGGGTVVFSRICGDMTADCVRAVPHISGVSVSHPHQDFSECGDGWSWKCSEDRISVLVADGLGHGPEAAKASDAAVELFDSSDQTVSNYMHDAHAQLQRTRGAAVAIAEVADTQVLFTGVGNISGVITSSSTRDCMISRHGTVGRLLPSIRTYEHKWLRRSILIMHSDGLTAKWNLADYPGLARHHAGIISAVLFRDCRRTNDDVTVVVLK